MADNEVKNYFSFLDIPDGSGGTERWHAKDAEAQAAIQVIEREIEELDPASVENKANKVASATSGHLAGLDGNGDLTDSGKAPTDFAAASHTHTSSEVGLGNVTNDAQVKRTEMGSANGVASLDSTGKVPSSQLPSYVDDVIEGYYYNSKFYEESTHTTEITPESGKIYVDLATDKTYRWSGSAYTQIKGDLALGETESTAYRGDRGKTAYDHSQSTHARTDATKTEASETNGNIKINGTETTVYTHPGSGTNPHGTTKSDVGLGNVGNFKAVSTEASQGLTDTEKGNARTNIGAGTYSKPSGGIPKKDLADAVQTSLGKADTAIQDVSDKADKSATVSTVGYDTTNKKITKTINGTTTDVVNSADLVADGINAASGYATCPTAADINSKQVTLAGFKLVKGARISVKFTYNVNGGANMNVNSTGGISILLGDVAIPSNVINAGDVATFVYDGSWYQLISVTGDAPRATFVGNALVFSSGGVFSGTTLLLS